MWRMSNKRMDYAWGSRFEIPTFLGEDPSGTKVAEIWIGAHVKASSVLKDFFGNDVPLDEAIRDSPGLLGDDVFRRFDGLPFLVKLLAADSPLSLQVHPSEKTAREGFLRESSQGIPLDARERTYKDPHHKPEVMVALRNTETLVGFRDADEARVLLRQLAHPWADEIAGLLDDRDMTRAFRSVLNQSEWTRARTDIIGMCQHLSALTPMVCDEDRDRELDKDYRRAFSLVGELDRIYPDDPGVAAPLLLNISSYAPGQALFIPTGVVHAHIHGFGIEVMAASDNVIRAGLTSKYIDVGALSACMVTTPTSPHVVDVESRLQLPVDEFLISIVTDDVVDGFGPRVVLAHLTSCSLSLGSKEIGLNRGQSAFVAHGESPMVQGTAMVFSVPQ